MANIKVSPEGLEIANAYLETSSIEEVAKRFHITAEAVSTALNKAEVKRYIDSVYLDLGYRNRFKLGSLLDKIIDSKLEEAEESEIYSNKDLVDILHLAHKMRMDEIKAQEQITNIANQTNVQINESPFGSGNYGKLMDKLLGAKTVEVEDNG